MEITVLDRNKKNNKYALEDPSYDEDNLIYHRAFDEATELIRNHQNGFLPPKPGSAYRYNPESQPLERPNVSSRGITNIPQTSYIDLGLDKEAVHTIRQASDKGTHGGMGRMGGHPITSEPTNSTPAVTPLIDSINHSETKPQAKSGLAGNDSTITRIQNPVGESKQYSEGSRRAASIFNRSSRARYRESALTSASSHRQNPLSWVDIHRNPRSQSHDPSYTTNANSMSTSSLDSVPKKHGMEIRADYILEATKMRLKGRNSKLPTPTAVSDDPGRPIVSFDAEWCDLDNQVPAGVVSDESNMTSIKYDSDLNGADVAVHTEFQEKSIPIRQTHSKSSDITDFRRTSHTDPATGGRPTYLATVSPTRSCDKKDPNITSKVSNITGAPDCLDNDRYMARPLPCPISNNSGANLQGTAITESSSGNFGAEKKNSYDCRLNHSPMRVHNEHTIKANHYTVCHECRRPIMGRVVRLTGAPEQYHPECFSCATCGTNLEALEIHPEPNAFRRERLDRILRRSLGHVLQEIPGKTMAEDGDERLRFYCHLDWHELFAPRCKHCKTPILGDHIVALGAHWHQGHFFCAECGDPFGNDATHIVKDGYAWCIRCQTRLTERRAPKCKKCKEAVIGNYVKAMGGEWHSDCFRCMNCNGTFDDGQIYQQCAAPGKLIVTCTQCRATELKS